MLPTNLHEALTRAVRVANNVGKEEGAKDARTISMLLEKHGLMAAYRPDFVEQHMSLDREATT